MILHNKSKLEKRPTSEQQTLKYLQLCINLEKQKANKRKHAHKKRNQKIEVLKRPVQNIISRDGKASVMY